MEKNVDQEKISSPAYGDTCLILSDQEQLYLSWIMCRQFHQQQYIPGWTGFNIRVRDQVALMESTVQYLDCLDTPATETATIQEVMERALKMKDALKISETVCVFDLSIFAKAAEIKWKSPEKYKDCVLVLGAFRRIMSFMSILAKRFGDAGVRDTLV